MGDSRVYGSVHQYKEHTSAHSGILILRVEASLMFANVDGFRTFILTKLSQNDDQINSGALSLDPIPVASADRIHTIIVDLSTTTHVDASAWDVLIDMVEDLHENRHIKVLYANPTPEVLESSVHYPFENDMHAHRFNTLDFI